MDTKSISGNIYENSGMVHVGLVPRNGLRYLQTILIMGAAALVNK